MFTVYVLYSENHMKFYTGCTSDLNKRFLSHNKLGTKGWTVKYRPWKIIYTEEFLHKSLALKREKELKSGKGRTFIRNIIDNQ